MIRFAFVSLVFIHGLIHLMGFAKAYNLGEIQQLKNEISKPAGITWLITSLLFIFTGICYLLNKSYWPFFSIIAILISQALIIYSWSDAKYGTITNVIILLITIPAIGQASFNRMANKEKQELLKSITSSESHVITTKDIEKLPPVIQRWMNYSAVINKKPIQFVRLKQKGEMKTAPGAKWMKFTAEQYFNVDNPSFIWTTHVDAAPLLYLNGRDKLQSGKGEMLIQFLSLYNVVDEGNNEKMNTGTMLRFLGELCWFPSAALNSYIRWEEIDSLSAKAIFSFGGTSVSGVYKFMENGELISFEAERFYGGGPDAVKEKWIIRTTAFKDCNGFRIPTTCSVIWRLKDGDFNWLNLEITDIDVNNISIYN